MESPHNLRLQRLSPQREPGPGEALVRILRVGICGTDLHAYRGRQPMLRYPLVPGHELAVEVLDLGPPLPDQEQALPVPGDVCTVVPYLADGTCHACRRGLPNCCENLQVLGVHTDGGLQSEMLLPASSLLKTGGLDPEAVALTEMLAIGRHAVRRTHLDEADTVVIVGAGPIGLSCLAFAGRPPDGIAVVDTDPGRLQHAREAFGVPDFRAGEQLGEQLREHFSGQRPTVVLDATGSAASMSASLQLAAHGGQLTFVGHTAEHLSFSNPVLHQRELTIRASRNATRQDFADVLKALAAGKVNPAAWISHRVSPEALPEAFASWTSGVERPVKAIVEMA